MVVGLIVKQEGELKFKEWTVDHWVVTVSAIELHQCMEPVAWSWIPSAYAHVPSSSTRLGTPVAEDLARLGGGARIIGEISPPPGRYCRAYAVFSPADDDLLNMSALPTSVLEGNTALRVRSRTPEWEETGSESSAEHTVVDTWKGRRAVPFDLFDETGKAGIELHSRSHAQILLEMVVDHDVLSVDDALENGHKNQDIEAWMDTLFRGLRTYSPARPSEPTP